MENEIVAPQTETKQGFIKRTINAVSESSCTAKVLLVAGVVGGVLVTYAVRKGATITVPETDITVEEEN